MEFKTKKLWVGGFTIEAPDKDFDVEISVCDNETIGGLVSFKTLEKWVKDIRAEIDAHEKRSRPRVKPVVDAGLSGGE